MLLILGGLASLPIDPYEAAKIDGASPWQAFRHITLPLLAPFIVVALIIRTIDALKAFDTIYVITQGGPGQASETINIFSICRLRLLQHGLCRAVVVVFFASSWSRRAAAVDPAAGARDMRRFDARSSAWASASRSSHWSRRRCSSSSGCSRSR